MKQAKKTNPYLNVTWPTLALPGGLLLSSNSFAAQTHVKPKGENDGFERCLVGEADGKCLADGHPKNRYGGKKSILQLIREDIIRTSGVQGKFVRVDDNRDKAFKYVQNRQDGSGINTEVGITARARYAGNHLSFGIYRGQGPVDSSQARPAEAERPMEDVHLLLYGIEGKNDRSIFLSDCQRFDEEEYIFDQVVFDTALAEKAVDYSVVQPHEADYCSPAGDGGQETTRMEQVLKANEFYRPAVIASKRNSLVVSHIFTSNPVDNLVTRSAAQPFIKWANDNATHPDAPKTKNNMARMLGDESLYDSDVPFESAYPTIKDHLVTFRFVADNPAEASKVNGLFILAFEDHFSYDTGDSDYNDLVIELRNAKLADE